MSMVKYMYGRKYEYGKFEYGMKTHGLVNDVGGRGDCISSRVNLV